MNANSHGPTPGEWRSLSRSTLVVVGLVLFTVTAGVSGATAPADTESFEVVLDENGDATVTITSTYDLSVDERRQAFRSLERDQATRDQYATDWADQLGTVAADASAATGRSMQITSPTVTATTTPGGETGMVSVTVTWTNMAAVDGDQLRLTEPFASGFTPDRQFTVVAPDGYRLTGTAPAPATTDTATAAWHPGSSLSGFQVTATPADTGAGGDSLPGFGPLVAVSAVLLAVGLARSRG